MNYNTKRKNEILSFLNQNKTSSFSIKEISDAILENGKGESTLYRHISALVEQGKIKRLADNSTRHITYQFVGGDECHSHLHLKCMECGKLIHLDESLTHTLLNNIKKETQFALDEGAVLFGKCEGCK